RATAATILWRMAGEPAVTFDPVFSDVASGQWYSIAITWASQNGIVLGHGDGTFTPQNRVTREQFATMLWRYAEALGYDVTVPANFSLANFTDHGQVSDWALVGMRWANYNQFINGRTTTTLEPGGTTIRAEAATIVYRFMTA
ncbi:MAG: S-layer homology domain-containing protein, partial [Oscillospiraceae bacterium]|nr:S-layer homology domain-containing protein [Oscillospiraceae bacterium]